MKVCINLVSCLTLVVVVVTHAAVIPRHERVVTGIDAASETGGMEDQLRREGSHNPSHRRHEHRHHEHLHRGHSNCPGCRQWQELTRRNSEEELIQLRIEKIKQDLLSRLGLSAPPNVSINRVPENIPDPLQYRDDDYYSSGSRSEFLKNEDGDELIEGHSKQIIVFADEVAFLHKRRPSQRRSLHFVLPPEVPADVVTSVELWLYKDIDSDRDNCTNSTQTFSIHSLDRDTSHRPSNQTRILPLASQEVSPQAGWFQMDLLDVVRSWMSNPRTNRGLDAEHSDCVHLSTELSHRPFLAIGTRRGNARRRKRDTQQCRDGQNCCRKHSLYINFNDLGWNFIVSPPGYHANYCHGPCSVPSLENLLGAHQRHATILQKYSRRHNNSSVLPCCSPTALSSLSLLYMDDKGLVIREDLSNMKVDSCGCS